MGQTLTHGIYLPDEGERNCYNGLAGNWQLLDGAVGTIAEHTSALSGKAPLVHTHTKADITDFPVYGTTAGTICEGNDSRLSDARTPVAHTHTKSDVTDLLNSDFIPSANNSYNLGSSSYQWNNLYAKSYYYNGVAWGLDKANVWTKLQTISYTGSNVAIALKNQETDIVASPTRNNWHYINFYDKNSVALGGFYYSKRTTGNSRVYLNLRTKNTNNDIIENNIFFETDQEGTDWNLYPSSDANIGLGTSTNKWKTLNGINPGALSLPNAVSSASIAVDTTNWILTGTSANKYTPTVDGWLELWGPKGNLTTAFINVDHPYTRCTSEVSECSYVKMMIPCKAGEEYSIYVLASSIACRFIPCLGNV